MVITGILCFYCVNYCVRLKTFFFSISVLHAVANNMSQLLLFHLSLKLNHIAMHYAIAIASDIKYFAMLCHVPPCAVLSMHFVAAVAFDV